MNLWYYIPSDNTDAITGVEEISQIHPLLVQQDYSFVYPPGWNLNFMHGTMIIKSKTMDLMDTGWSLAQFVKPYLEWRDPVDLIRGLHQFLEPWSHSKEMQRIRGSSLMPTDCLRPEEIPALELSSSDVFGIQKFAQMLWKSPNCFRNTWIWILHLTQRLCYCPVFCSQKSPKLTRFT